jgi:hypothetical protein
MISETFFAANYPSVWRTIAPSMEDFVRRMNTDRYEREWTPLQSVTHPGRRGLINEAAFILFTSAVCERQEPTANWMRAKLSDVFEVAFNYVGERTQLEGSDLRTENEEKETINIASRLFQFFRHWPSENLTVAPSFPGCGILSPCVGDILVSGKEIYEIKSGDRPFRSVDYRQLSVYLALHFSATGSIFESLNIINPRTGRRVNVAAEDFTRDISGRSAISFCQSLIDSFSLNLASG